MSIRSTVPAMHSQSADEVAAEHRDSRTKVLDAALFLFTERGYFNTSVNNIARYAGVSIGSIYHHFHDKAGVAQALYDALLGRMVQELNSLRARHPDTRAYFRAVVEHLFQVAEREPASMMFMLHARHREFLPGQQPICSSQPFRLLQEAVAEGIERGDLRRVEPVVAATALFGGPLRLLTARLDGALEQPLTAFLDETCACGWRAVAP